MADHAHNTTTATIARRRHVRAVPGALDRRPVQLHGAQSNPTIEALTGHFFDGMLHVECYAARIEGDCCSPWLKSGDAALVSPVETAQVGDFVVLFPADGSIPLIERLVMAPLFPIGAVENPARAVASVVLVETLTPARVISIRASSLSAMHRVVGVVRQAEASQGAAPAPAVRRPRRRRQVEVAA